jgi:subtilisin family serine protease
MKSPVPRLILLCLVGAILGQDRPADRPWPKVHPDLARVLAGSKNPDSRLKVWVAFRDKGFAGEAELRKAMAETRTGLGESCLSRRAKVLGEKALVHFEDLPLARAYAEAVRTKVTAVRAESRWQNALSVEASPAEVESLASLPFVAEISPVKGFRRTGEDVAAEVFPWPRGPLYGPAYRQIDQVNVRPLHTAGLSGRGVRVCLLDIGFRKSHQVFRFGRVVAERDFVLKDNDVQRNPNDPSDYSDAHGTATWSLLGGMAPGALIGPAFGADFILGKTEDGRSETPVEEDYWVAGVEWAESLGADVVSSSLGYTDWYQFKDMDGRTAVTTRAANRAAALGVVIVNAAGNDRRTAWGHIIAPADGPEVLAVGAVDDDGRISSFSSPGPTADGRTKPEVCALGVRNFVAASSPTSGDSSYQWGNGTSYATPLVAGVVALLLEAHPDWTPRQVREALLSTASRSGAPDNDYGWGVVNAAAAVLYAPSKTLRE